MAQSGTCPGTQFPIAGQCTRALVIHPDGLKLSLGNRIFVYFFAPLFILGYLDCIAHYIAKKKYGNGRERLIDAKTIVCLVGFLSFGSILVGRTEDYSEHGKEGIILFTFMMMIHMGATLVTIALLSMHFVDFALTKDGYNHFNSKYSFTTKIICALYLIVAAGQAVFYAWILIKYEGKKVKWVRATHYVTIGTNVLGIVMAALMFLVGYIMNNTGVKSIRNIASMCVSWSLKTTLCCLINIYCIVYYHFQITKIPNYLPKYVADLLRLQQELTPYIVTNLLLFFSPCFQHYSNLVILAYDYIYPLTSLFKWAGVLFGYRYKFPVIVTTSRVYATRNRSSNAPTSDNDLEIVTVQEPDGTTASFITSTSIPDDPDYSPRRGSVLWYSGTEGTNATDIVDEEAAEHDIVQN